MLAFTADYESGDILIDNVEIEEAGWYDRDNLQRLPSSSKSIAMKLIDGFFEDQSSEVSAWSSDRQPLNTGLGLPIAT